MFFGSRRPLTRVLYTKLCLGPGKRRLEVPSSTRSSLLRCLPLFCRPLLDVRSASHQLHVGTRAFAWPFSSISTTRQKPPFNGLTRTCICVTFHMKSNLFTPLGPRSFSHRSCWPIVIDLPLLLLLLTLVEPGVQQARRKGQRFSICARESELKGPLKRQRLHGADDAWPRILARCMH